MQLSIFQILKESSNDPPKLTKGSNYFSSKLQYVTNSNTEELIGIIKLTMFQNLIILNNFFIHILFIRPKCSTDIS